VVHEVEKGGNLDLLLRGFHGIGNRAVDAIGDGLEAIALALSTPQDNSEQVTEFAAKVRAVREKLKASVDAQTKGD
jgi:hypothetical protein